ncbi:MAG: hypothetical protein PF495_02550 [Spirochaetales bacterium]|jgi:hypothetical protein|nr:hypothetical protein [Spirochaetales bacterium]
MHGDRGPYNIFSYALIHLTIFVDHLYILTNLGKSYLNCIFMLIGNLFECRRKGKNDSYEDLSGCAESLLANADTGTRAVNSKKVVRKCSVAQARIRLDIS